MVGATHALDPRDVDPVDAVADLTEGQGVAMAVECTGNFGAVMRSIEGALAVGASRDHRHGRPASGAAIHRLPTKGGVRLRIARPLRLLGFPKRHRADGIWSNHAKARAITRRHPLESLVDAIEETKNRGDGKVLVKPGV